jgi:hypothetical protein
VRSETATAARIRPATRGLLRLPDHLSNRSVGNFVLNQTGGVPVGAAA